jgi:hypothetical protein
MATVNLGSIKFKWKGTYSGATAYTVDDVVEYNGSSYICILASTGNLPTNATYFEQMSQKGTDADLLSIASTAQGDIYYNNGGAIARLGAGTSGAYCSANGGLGGYSAGSYSGAPPLASATGGDLNLTGQGTNYSMENGNGAIVASNGGGSFWSGGGSGAYTAVGSAGKNGSGGGGGSGNSANNAGGSGGDGVVFVEEYK